MATTTELKLVSENRCHSGWVRFFSHASEACNGEMTFSVFLPPQAESGKPLPVLTWLSGLTCTAENFTVKAGAQQHAAEHGLVLVAPDTSPRGAGLEGEDDDYDFGTGAGFYVNATQEPWSRFYNMYDYVTAELPQIVAANFPVDDARQGIFGHSMGGHGALVCALRNPGRYRSVSAFAPICAPMDCPWGHKAFSNYLGDDQAQWAQYDANRLVPDAGERLPLLIDQGDADNFLQEQLKPEILQATCKEHGHPIAVRMRTGYDHSYYFIASFMAEHIAHHATALKG